jgi:hypothetical protein
MGPHGRHAFDSQDTPLAEILISVSCRGQPATEIPSHRIATSGAVQARPRRFALRTCPRGRCTPPESGVLAFETMTADGTKESDAIDVGSTGGFGDVTPRRLEQLSDVMAFEALEELGLGHAQG